MSELESVEAMFGITSMPVHITNPKEVAYSHLHEKDKRTSIRAVYLNAQNPSQKILSAAPTRCRALVWQGNLAVTNSPVLVSHSNAAMSSGSRLAFTALPVDLPGILFNTPAAGQPVEFHADDEIWITLFTDGTAALVNIIEEYEAS